MTQGKMFKVMMPVENEDKKTTHWLRLGSGFGNKDESINCYVESLPISVFSGKELKFQIRELTEDDHRRREAARERRGPGAGAGQAAVGAVPY